MTRQQRRRQMEAQRVAAFEAIADFLQEAGLGIQPRHFVFILDRHQLEKVVRDGYGELRGVSSGFCGADLFYLQPISLRVGGILIVGEKSDAR